MLKEERKSERLKRKQSQEELARQLSHVSWERADLVILPSSNSRVHMSRQFSFVNLKKDLGVGLQVVDNNLSMSLSATPLYL